MKCPECGSPGLVLQSRFSGKTKRRRRRCSNPDCDCRYTSCEFIVSKWTPDSVKAYISYLCRESLLTVTEKIRLQRRFAPPQSRG